VTSVEPLKSPSSSALFQWSTSDVHRFSINVAASLKFQAPGVWHEPGSSGPTTVSRHRTKFSRPGHRVRCIYVPLVSALRVQVWRHLTLPHSSLLDTKQVCGKFIAIQWKTALRSVLTLCLAAPFCQPFVITHHSSWLFTFAEYSCMDNCNTAVCYMGRSWNSMAEMCCGSTGGGHGWRQ